MVFGLSALKKKFFKIEDVMEFHFTLTNIIMLITEKYEEGGYYCYCDTYRDCCLYPIIRHFLDRGDLYFMRSANCRGFAVKRMQ